MKPVEFFSHWAQVRGSLVRIIDSFDDSELAMEPFEGSWPAGRIMLHIAEAEDGWLRYIVSGELDAWPERYTLVNYPDKQSIQFVLDQVHAWTDSFIAGLIEADLARTIKTPRGDKFSLMWVIWHVIEHEIHHRGELSLILGTLGREGWG
jgi:uncharacterized damage-inducible protein DinB